MSIIDREIQKREALIEERFCKENEAVSLREKADILEKEAAAIDVETLKAEVEELKTFLPHEEAAVPSENVDGVVSEELESNP